MCTTEVHQHGVFILGSVNLQNISTNIGGIDEYLGNRTGLKLGEESYLVIFYKIQFLSFFH